MISPSLASSVVRKKAKRLIVNIIFKSTVELELFSIHAIVFLIRTLGQEDVYGEESNIRWYV